MIINLFYLFLNIILYLDLIRIRSIASPTFSSGKLRAMIPLMNKCVRKLVDYMDSVVPSTGSRDLNIKEVVTGFTIDVGLVIVLKNEFN